MDGICAPVWLIDNRLRRSIYLWVGQSAGSTTTYSSRHDSIDHCTRRLQLITNGNRPSSLLAAIPAMCNFSRMGRNRLADLRNRAYWKLPRVFCGAGKDDDTEGWVESCQHGTVGRTMRCYFDRSHLKTQKHARNTRLETKQLIWRVKIVLLYQDNRHRSRTKK